MNEYRPEGALISTLKNKEYTSSRAGLAAALEGGMILEGTVISCDHSFNLHLELGAGVRAIIPRAEVQHRCYGEAVKDIAILTRVGKTVAFKVLGFEKLPSGEEIAILSRRAAQRECFYNYISALTPGDIIPTKITHLENFGAFVDIGCGITSLLSIDCISVSRISHPSSRLGVGDVIYTVVKTIDEKGRIYVSERELLGSWEENAALFREGETVKGIIRSVEDYGIFVELRPNLAGLAEYKTDARPGQTAAVYIKSIIPEKMKIKLIIIDSFDSSHRESVKYFVGDTHISSWHYSPKNSCKKIFTEFD